MSTLTRDTAAVEPEARLVVRGHASRAAAARRAAAYGIGEDARRSDLSPSPDATAVHVGPAARALAAATSRAERIDAERAADAAGRARLQIAADDALGVRAQASRLPHGLVDLLR